MFKRILSKSIWIWERKRPYFLNQALSRLSPVSAVCESGNSTINVLCTPDTLNEATFAAWSWCRCLGSNFGIRIVVDGVFDKCKSHSIGLLIDGVEVISARDLIDPDLFSMKGLGSIGLNHPMGRKLLIPLSLQRHEDHIYVDNDVLLFNYPQQILDARHANLPAYNQESGPSCYSKDILRRAADLGLTYCQALNGGLFYCPKNSFDIDIANELALAKESMPYSWFDEQTIFAVLMSQANATALDRNTYVVSTQRQFWPEKDVDYSGIASRHFTSPVRHLMYSRGYAHLLHPRH